MTEPKYIEVTTEIIGFTNRIKQAAKVLFGAEICLLVPTEHFPIEYISVAGTVVKEK